jgi:predicted nucleic acid-binding protein
VFVVDASMALAWCFADEATTRTEQVMERLVHEGGIAPAHWSMEVANGLRFAASSGRVDDATIARAREIVRQLPIEIRPVETSTALFLIEPARQHDLTVCDAAYLGLAEALGLGVATLDQRLAAACRTVGVPLIG